MSLAISSTLAASIQYTEPYDSSDLGTGIYTDGAEASEVGTFVLAGGNSTITTSVSGSNAVVGTANATVTAKTNGTALTTDTGGAANAGLRLAPLAAVPAAIMLLL